MIYVHTCALIPLFVPEADSAIVRAWFGRYGGGELGISDWTLTEFDSALGIKVRSREVKARDAVRASALMQRLADESLIVLAPTRTDYRKASECLARHRLGLRAGDALHLAIAQRAVAESFCTLDRRLASAARELGAQVIGPS